MRLVTWNCKGAFGRKHPAAAQFKPDVLIVPECGKLEGTVPGVLGLPPVNSFDWIGVYQTKGLGVISYGDYSLRRHPDYDPDLNWILPLEVKGPRQFTLIAVWSVRNPVTGFYLSPLLDALEAYKHLFHESEVIVAGDFNQNVLFDTPRGKVKYADWLSKAEELGLRSVYHLDRQCEQGREPEKTFFLHHKEEKGHHLDYIFATPGLLENGVAVEVGNHADWHKASDHMPLACSFG
jgi:exodeoxyribonuclease III